MIQDAFGTFAQAESSWDSSESVRLCIAYLESVLIVRLDIGGEICSATTIAAISPVWLDCAGPGTWIALFRECLSVNQTPAPQVALCWLLWRQELSVKVVRGGAAISCGKQSAGRAEIGWEAKILKHLDRLVLVITDGLNTSSSPFATSAFTFFSRRRWVKVRPSFCIGVVGLSFKDSFIAMASAVLAHL